MEKIDVLNEFGLRTGEVIERKEIHKLGKLHRAVHFYLFNKSNKLLLQKRSQKADHLPEIYSISVVGHIKAGESSFQALKREVNEELGLETEKLNIEFLFSFRQDYKINPNYIDKQFNDIYCCFHDFEIKDLNYEKETIVDFKLVSIEEFKLMLKSDQLLSSIYLNEFNDLVYFLKNRF
ncbi:MAG: NUDIX domain-containing protein [Bacteroidetes bacterium]|nr:NUDIX domain-containing protein [Bacteroidota bacterium]